MTTRLVSGIGGFFFRSANPARLADWYATHLGIDGPQGPTGPWLQDSGRTVIAPFPEDSDYFAETKRWMLNLRVTDLDALAKQLEAAGIAVLQDDSWNSEVGRFARIHDPEGNPIELWEPSAMVLETP